MIAWRKGADLGAHLLDDPGRLVAEDHRLLNRNRSVDDV